MSQMKQMGFWSLIYWGSGEQNIKHQSKSTCKLRDHRTIFF